MIEALQNHKLDFVIDVVPVDNRYNNIQVEELKIIDNIFVAKQPIEIKKIKELENYEYILNIENTMSTNELQDILKKHKISIKASMEFDTTELRVEVAKQGLGIAYVMKEMVKRELDNNELYELKLPIKLPQQKINLIYARGQLTKADKQFIKKYLKM